jgi:hypothetical protein
VIVSLLLWQLLQKSISQSEKVGWAFEDIEGDAVVGERIRRTSALSADNAAFVNRAGPRFPGPSGCAPGLLSLVACLAPRAIAYLSCDPETLARDLALLATHGYRTRAVTPCDMLPHTPHIEVLAVLALS